MNDHKVPSCTQVVSSDGSLRSLTELIGRPPVGDEQLLFDLLILGAKISTAVVDLKLRNAVSARAFARNRLRSWEVPFEPNETWAGLCSAARAWGAGQ